MQAALAKRGQAANMSTDYERYMRNPMTDATVMELGSRVIWHLIWQDSGLMSWLDAGVRLNIDMPDDKTSWPDPHNRYDWPYLETL